ncbi:MAG TPA: hypothetical protein VN721_09580 [Flavipsychrobacter sp.]|nr:hypothetical protein [Flavipsychrobacter sp.]
MKTATRQAGFGNEMPPERAHLSIYFIQKGLSEKEADFFYQQQESNSWKTKRGKPIRNWKAVAADWIWEYQQIQKRRQRHLLTDNSKR